MPLDLLGILSSPSVILALVIIVIGVSLKTWSGMIGKPIKSININLVILTFFISTITAIGLVVPAIENISPDVTPTTLLALIAGQILTIYGADGLVKSVVKSKVLKRNRPEVTTE